MQIDYSQQSLNKVASGLLLVFSRHRKKFKITEMKSFSPEEISSDPTNFNTNLKEIFQDK